MGLVFVLFCFVFVCLYSCLFFWFLASGLGGKKEEEEENRVGLMRVCVCMYVMSSKNQLTLQALLSPCTAIMSPLLATMPASRRAEEEEEERDGRGCDDGDEG